MGLTTSSADYIKSTTFCANFFSPHGDGQTCGLALISGQNSCKTFFTPWWWPNLWLSFDFWPKFVQIIIEPISSSNTTKILVDFLMTLTQFSIIKTIHYFCPPKAILADMSILAKMSKNRGLKIFFKFKSYTTKLFEDHLMTLTQISVTRTSHYFHPP